MSDGFPLRGEPILRDCPVYPALPSRHSRIRGNDVRCGNDARCRVPLLACRDVLFPVITLRQSSPVQREPILLDFSDSQLAGRDSHGPILEDPRIHRLEVLCNQRPKLHLVEDVFFQVHPGRDLREQQPAGHQLKNAAFGDE